MKENIYKDIPPYAQHFLVHVVKRSAMVLVKWISNMQNGNFENIPLWVQDFLVHVGKENAMILVCWIDDMKEEVKNNGKSQNET